MLKHLLLKGSRLLKGLSGRTKSNHYIGCFCRKASSLLASVGDRRAYFVHSYCAAPAPANDEWVLATSHYGMDFIAAVKKGDVHATQFHPEKSGPAGLAIIDSFLNSHGSTQPEEVAATVSSPAAPLGSLESPFKAGALLSEAEQLGRIKCLRHYLVFSCISSGSQ